MHVMCRHHHRGAEAIERFEQPQQLQRHFRIDIACRLVRHQHFGPGDHRAGDGATLLLTAGQRFRPGIGAMVQPHPAQHVVHRFLHRFLAHAGNAQRQGDIVEGGQMRDEAEVLEHRADAAAELRQLAVRQGDHILAEHRNAAA